MKDFLVLLIDRHGNRLMHDVESDRTVILPNDPVTESDLEEFDSEVGTQVGIDHYLANSAENWLKKVTADSVSSERLSVDDSNEPVASSGPDTIP